MGKNPDVLQMHSDNVEASYFDILELKRFFILKYFFIQNGLIYPNLTNIAKVGLEILDFFNLSD